MKGNTNRLKICICIFLVFSTLIQSQDRKSKTSEFVKSFFEDVFINNKPLDQMAKEYRYKDSKIKSENEAVEMFQAYISYLKTTQQHLLDKQDIVFKVEHYNECIIDDLWLFEKRERKNIFVVSVEDEIVTYVLLKKNKIFSFVYFRKGSESTAYFIPYYKKQEF